MSRGSGVPVREFDVFLHLRGKRPKKIDVTQTTCFPVVWTHEGHEYYFVTADLSALTVTYTDVRPQPAVGGN